MRLVWLLVGLVAAFAGCENTYDVPPRFESETGEAFGTTYVVKTAGEYTASELESLHDEINTELAAIDRRVSTWNEMSHLSRFNRAAAGDAIPVDAITAGMVEQSMDLSAWTEGAFDPTIGPVVELWNFGSRRSSEGVPQPSSQAISDALAATGPSTFEIERKPRLALRKLMAGAELDLSAFAKGNAVDRLAAITAEVATNWMVEIGGEVRVSDARPDGAPWMIGITDPSSDPFTASTPLIVVPLRDCSMATSGDYRNFQRIGSERVSHTIDPRTGRPVSHRLTSVTVLADTCGEADALATALMVMGADDALVWAEREQVACLLVERSDSTEAGELIQKRSTSFADRVAKMTKPLAPTPVTVR